MSLRNQSNVIVQKKQIDLNYSDQNIFNICIQLLQFICLFAFQVLGKVGKIVKIDSDGDVAVVFGQKAVVLNPACCILAPGCRPDEIGGSADKGSSDGDGIVNL